jgi:hypothetical protein
VLTDRCFLGNCGTLGHPLPGATGYVLDAADSLCWGVWLGRKTATRQRQSPKVHSETTETSRRA